MLDRSSKGETPFILVEGGHETLVLVDHASNAVPAEMAGLGLPSFELERHIGYDIGALEAGRAMAEALGATLIHTTVSRLVIDPNRGEDDPTLVMRIADGAIVPGNAYIGADEVARRLDKWYRPYHDVIEQRINAALAAGVVPVIIAMHSFTAAWKGVPRPWHVGVLWDLDDRIAHPLIDRLALDSALVVGDNEPYDGALRGDTCYRHGTARGLAHVLIEVRQDLIGTDADARAWGLRLADVLTPILARGEVRTVQPFGTRTDP
jgi:predicted N-formylglutamate amidohydrolase